MVSLKRGIVITSTPFGISILELSVDSVILGSEVDIGSCAPSNLATVELSTLIRSEISSFGSPIIANNTSTGAVSPSWTPT